MANTAAERVFTAWAKTRPRPHLCRLSGARRKLIANRLKEYSADDLVAVVRYANEADEGWPRWMRGDNPRGRAYLDLENLFRVEKLASRVEDALLWLEGAGDGPQTPPPDDGLDLGPMAAFFGQAT